MADPLLRFWLHRWLKCQWVMIPWPSHCHHPPLPPNLERPVCTTWVPHATRGVLGSSM